MARIRSLKPGFFINEQLATVAFEWRLLFAGLWTQADRNGRLEDRPMRLKATLFPYDDLDVNDGLGRLANAGLITRYERDGAKYIAIPTWLKHQQPHKKEVPGQIPGPSGEHEPETSTVLAPDKHSASPPDQGADPDQGAENTPRARRADDALVERFERFWQAYPRKVGKDAARAVWMRRHPSEELTVEIIAAIGRQAQSNQWRRDGGQFIPHPRTWLSQGRWQDSAESTATRDEKPFTPHEERHAVQVRKSIGRCMHDPECDSYAACLATIVRSNRQKAMAS